MPPADVILYYLLGAHFISSAPLPHNNNDNGGKEVRQNLMSHCYSQ
jgi:hypothetical protein